MYRKHTPQSPYSVGSQGDVFISPMARPRHHSSPRFQQQFVPHHSGPGMPPGGPCWGPPPPHHGHGQSRSPHYAARSPRPDFNQSGYSPRHPNFNNSSDFSSPRHCSFDSRGPSPNNHSGSYNNRGRYSFNKDMFSPRGAGPDCNPGGSDDIRQYFNPSMLSDPWENMRPVSNTIDSSTTSTTS